VMLPGSAPDRSISGRAAPWTATRSWEGTDV
jgi:hypothetical protein